MQGEHLFRHLFAELGGVAGAERLLDDVWTIRAEVVSPVVKTRTLLGYAELFVRRAEDRLAKPRRRTSARRPKVSASTPDPSRTDPAVFPAVGRDVKPARPDRTGGPHRQSKTTRRSDVEE